MTRIRLALALLALLVAACASDVGRIDANLTAQTSAPKAATDHLTVNVTAVKVHIAGAGDVEVTDDADGTKVEDTTDGAGWVTVFAGTQMLDLFDTVGVNTFLASTTVPAGKVTQVRLILAAMPTATLGTDVFNVACPSCTQTGIKIVPSGNLVVPAGGVLDLTLIFALDQSMTLDGTSLRLDPVLHLEGEVKP